VSVVRTVYGNSSGFEVKVGMHQGSAMSPMLFVIVMEAISREFRVALPWELLYVDDLVVIAETEEDLIKRLNEWKNNVENRGVRVTHTQTTENFWTLWCKGRLTEADTPIGLCATQSGLTSAHLHHPP